MRHHYQTPTWIWLLAITALVLFAQCRKQHLPEPSTGDPVFSFTGTADGQAIDWQAGNGKRFMHTSFLTGNTGLYVFEGTLGGKDCPDCGPAIRLLLHDSHLRPPAQPIPPDSVVIPGHMPFIDFTFSVNRGLALSLQPMLMNFPPNPGYLWYFGDGTYSGDPSPTKVYQQPGQYLVCLTANDVTRQDSLCNVITITDQPRKCDALFSFQHLGGNMVEFRPAILDPGTKYRWSFNDETASGMPVTRKVFNNDGVYRVCLKVEKGGCWDQFCMRVPVPASFSIAANYTYQIAIDTSATLAGHAEVQWIDAQGSVYSSFRATPQPPGSRLEISNTEAYERNNAGQATRKFDFDTDVWLYRLSDPSDSLKLAGQGTFAVGYPD